MRVVAALYLDILHLDINKGEYTVPLSLIRDSYTITYELDRKGKLVLDIFAENVLKKMAFILDRIVELESVNTNTDRNDIIFIKENNIHNVYCLNEYEKSLPLREVVMNKLPTYNIGNKDISLIIKDDIKDPYIKVCMEDLRIYSKILNMVLSKWLFQQ